MEPLSIKSKTRCAAAMTAASLFAQWVHWFVFEKIEFSSLYLCFTPLILCLMYRFLMADCENKGRFTKIFINIFTIVVPLIISLIISLYILFKYPDTSTFSALKEEKNSPSELVSLYSGRLILTSLYLLVYSFLDAFIITKIWSRIADKSKKRG